MTRRTLLAVTTREQIARHVEQMGMNGYGTLAIAAAIRSMDLNAQQREWVYLTDREMMDVIDIDDSPMTMGRKIEAKSKEKNRG